jgi:glutathione-regulated potassium-efflux system protein KefB
LGFLREAFVYLAAAVLVVPLATRLGLGSVLGYLLAGVLIGPSALGLAAGGEGLLHVAELGVVLLLFLVGLELEPRRLAELRRTALGLGAAQVLLSGAAVAGLALAAGLPWRTAAVAGAGLALSSTALDVQLLAEGRELGSRHGQAAFGVLLFQDLAVIPMLALLPLLGGGGTATHGVPWLAAAKAAGAVAAVVVASRLVVRPALRFVAGLRNAELFTATALLFVAATALLVSSAGLSMALGAFLGGVLLATSEYRHELEADLAPFKGLLLGLFFMAVGTITDLSLLAREPARLLLAVALLVAAKFAVMFGVGLLRFRDADTAASLALVLSQGGEFAFVLFQLAGSAGVAGGGDLGALALVVTLSMATTPLLYRLHVRLVRPRLRARPRGEYDVAPEGAPPVLIAGFGRVGQVVGRLLRAKGVPFTAMDVSSEHIDFIRRFGSKVFYGDASRLDLLRAARADEARVFVLAIDDVEASLRTAEVVLAHFPHLEVFARARNRQHAYRLRRLGIRRIMRETLAGSLELTVDVLDVLGLERADAERTVARFREHDEALFEAAWPHQDDPDKLTDLARRGREELERLFQEDASDERRPSTDVAPPERARTAGRG